MIPQIEQAQKPNSGVLPFKSGLGYVLRKVLKKRSNKNIYTKILFSNLIVFIISLITLVLIANHLVKQITYHHFRQELLYKAERINSALYQLTLREKNPSALDGQNNSNLFEARKAWKRAQELYEEGIISKKESDLAKTRYYEAIDKYYKTADLQINAQIKSKHELLKYLGELFNAKRIIIFNQDGIITDTSMDYEIEFDTKVDEKFMKLLDKSKITIVKEVNGATKQTNLIAVIPNDAKQNNMEYGTLLEVEQPDFEGLINKTQLYLIGGGLGLLILIIIHSVYLAINISRPIFHLANAAMDLERGQTGLNVKDQALDEVKILATQLGKLLQQVHKVKADSIKLDEERTKLFTEISHELRTPLTSVQGFVEAIRDGMVQDKALLDRYLDTIYTQTVHIGRLVDDILILSRLESGNMTLEKQPLDMIALAQRVMASFEAEANQRNTILLLEKKTDKVFAIGDIDRMEQIIRNLIKNALKATENGTIKLSISSAPDEVILTIEDNGIGISAEDLPHIWERFYRAKSQRGISINEKGTGLGLAIVKRLVQLQDGSIDVESQLGKGTTFILRFPALK